MDMPAESGTIAVIAAMPGELGPLVRGWTREQGAVAVLWRRDGAGLVAACAGAGVDAAARAFAEIGKSRKIGAVVSVGWAGALGAACPPGSAYRVCTVVDALNGERFQAAGPPDGRALVTSPRVADPPEKARLAATFGADLVDMEAAGVARLAAARGIPFYCIKGVSDGPDGRLPDFNRFIAGDGGFRTAAFMVFALFRPWLWPALARMGVHSGRAAGNIAVLFEAMGPWNVK